MCSLSRQLNRPASPRHYRPVLRSRPVFHYLSHQVPVNRRVPARRHQSHLQRRSLPVAASLHRPRQVPPLVQVPASHRACLHQRLLLLQPANPHLLAPQPPSHHPQVRVPVSVRAQVRVPALRLRYRLPQAPVSLHLHRSRPRFPPARVSPQVRANPRR